MAPPRPGARPSSSSPCVTPAHASRRFQLAPGQRWIGRRASLARPARANSASSISRLFWPTNPVGSELAGLGYKLNQGRVLNNPRAKARWWVIFLLFTGTFINAIDRASLSTAAPNMMAELGMDAGMMGIALSAFFWSYIIRKSPAGGMADKYGVKRTLGWAAGLWSVCSALTGVATQYLHVVLARIGVGVGEAASFPVNARIVTNSFPPEERGTAVGCYTCGLRLGFAMTPILMACLISTWSWRFAFYVTGIGSLLWVVLWYFTYREPDREKATARAASKVPWMELLGNRTVLGLVLCKFFQDYLFYLFVTWLPAYLIMDRGFSIMKMGWYR